MPLQLVWFKRDLRWADHQPLIQALERGPVLPLYIVEPSIGGNPMLQVGSGPSAEALIDLREGLAALGQPLVVRCGDAVEVLERARRQLGVEAVWSHEETGNDWTYARDRRVAAWARNRNPGGDPPVRRDPTDALPRWAQRWEARMGSTHAIAAVPDTSLGGVPWRPAGRNDLALPETLAPIGKPVAGARA